MRHGIVLARNGRHATVLMTGGEFVRVPARDWRVGEEITLPDRLPLRVRARGMRAYGYAAAALAAVLALLPVLIPAASAQVVAYASVDVNPSLELGLSASSRVVSVTALDADAQVLVRNLHLKGDSLPQAVGAILGAAAQEGYLSKSHDVSVILAGYAAGSATLPASVEAGLRTARAEAATYAHRHHFVGVVSALIAPAWVRSAASRQHVSVGLYAVWSALQHANVRVSLRSLRGQALGKALAQVATSSKGLAVLQTLSGVLLPGTSPTRSHSSQRSSAPTTGTKGGSGSSQVPLIVVTGTSDFTFTSGDVHSSKDKTGNSDKTKNGSGSSRTSEPSQGTDKKSGGDNLTQPGSTTVPGVIVLPGTGDGSSGQFDGGGIPNPLTGGDGGDSGGN